MKTGEIYLGYAQEMFDNEDFESAIYLGCLAEEEFSNSGDINYIKAVDFVKKARLEYKVDLEFSFMERGEDITREGLEREVYEHCELGLLPRLRRIYDNYVKKDIIPFDLLKKIKNYFMTIPSLD